MSDLLQKEPLSDVQFVVNANEIGNIIQQYENFIFYFSPDPDAVGASVALALYIRNLEKKCTIYLPDGFDKNLDFLFQIAIYNNINVVSDFQIIKDILLQNKDAIIISCDTPTHFLLPNYDELIELVNQEQQKKYIEIDHHFGGDSEQTFKNSVVLFSKTNSCCEIIANLLLILDLKIKKLNDDIMKVYRENFWTIIEKIQIEKYLPRNIVLSLLVGICYDTQFGKFVTNKESFDRWFNLLSKRLQDLTWGDARKISTATMVFDTINRMNDIKQQTLDKYLKKTVVENAIGLLIMPNIGKYESLSKTKDSTCFFCKLVPDFSNLVPEFAGAIGIFTFYDTVHQIYYIKIRRSVNYKEYDLRQLELILGEVFGQHFLGGGGHEGATSFRVSGEISRQTYVKKIKLFLQRVSALLCDSTSKFSK